MTEPMSALREFVRWTGGVLRQVVITASCAMCDRQLRQATDHDEFYGVATPDDAPTPPLPPKPAAPGCAPPPNNDDPPPPDPPPCAARGPLLPNRLCVWAETDSPAHPHNVTANRQATKR